MVTLSSLFIKSTRYLTITMSQTDRFATGVPSVMSTPHSIVSDRYLAHCWSRPLHILLFKSLYMCTSMGLITISHLTNIFLSWIEHCWITKWKVISSSVDGSIWLLCPDTSVRFILSATGNGHHGLVYTEDKWCTDRRTNICITSAVSFCFGLIDFVGSTSVKSHKAHLTLTVGIILRVHCVHYI